MKYIYIYIYLQRLNDFDIYTNSDKPTCNTFFF